MKTSGIILFVSAFISLVYLTSCSRIRGIEGNGKVETHKRIADAFTGIRSEGSFDVFIVYDSVQSVSVEAETNLQAYIETEVSGSDLVIKSRGHKNLCNNFPIRIFIRTPFLERIDLSGSGNVDCSSINTSMLDLQLSGSGKISVITSGDKIKAKLSGSGGINLSGKADETNLIIKGSGDIRSYNLEQETCFADISGSGSMFLKVNKFLDVKISGSGDVHYTGNPFVKTDISGSGKVTGEW